MPAIFDATFATLAFSAVGNRLLFTGREWPAGLKLYDHRNRYYAPDMGRWVSKDPVEESGGVNLYGYVYKSVGGASDSFGLWAPPSSGYVWANFRDFETFKEPEHGPHSESKSCPIKREK